MLYAITLLSLAVLLLFLSARSACAATPDARLLALCREEEPVILALTEKLVNMDSGSDDFPELLAKKVVLKKMLEDLGAEVTVVEAPAPRQGTYHLVGRLRGKGKLKLMLMNHYDTVWPKGEAAKRPFTIKDGVAYGPGVMDTLCNFGAINSLIRILQRLGEENYDTITFLFNSDEEKFSACSSDLILETSEGQDIIFSLDGGGHDGEMAVVSCRGSAYCDIFVEGIESHSGDAPEKGVNAGYELAHQILKMRNLSDKEQRTDVNWTLGKFGSRSNVIPGSAWAQANIRIAKTSEWDRVEADIARNIQEKLFPQSKISMKFTRGRPPFEENPVTNALFAKAAQIYKDELGRDLHALHFGGGTDANYAYQKAPVLEAIGLGGSGLHSLDERLPLANIVPRLYLLVRLTLEAMRGNVPLKG